MKTSGRFLLVGVFSMVMFCMYSSFLYLHNPSSYVIHFSQVKKSLSQYYESNAYWVVGGYSDIMDDDSTSVKDQLYNRVNRRVDNERRIFISVVDTSYAEMAANLYLSSYKTLNISNFIFVGIDANACSTFSSYLRASEGNETTEKMCLTYFNETEGEKASVWPSKSFKRKTHYKSEIILDVLRLNVSVVIVDLDIVFFKVPLPYFNCTHCDVEVQSDIMEENSGFYIARPTKGSIEAHERSLDEKLTNSLSNQKILHRVFSAMKRKQQLTVRTLKNHLFPCGKIYFEDHKVMFPGDYKCEHCVIMHNNWIATREAKVYRFKEIGMWYVDKDQYYSNADEKYLLYENPKDFGVVETLQMETDALKAALVISSLLNRVLILPKFHCYKISSAVNWAKNSWCTFGSFFSIAKFDKQYAGRYRESVFLTHPSVPESVKESVSDVYLLETNVVKQYKLNAQNAAIVKSLGDTVTNKHITDWFGSMDDISVLRFHSLYGLTSLILNFDKQNYTALRKANYRQLYISNVKV